MRNLYVAAAKETGKVVTIEEHSVIGGLGSAVCDLLSARKLPTKGAQDWCTMILLENPVRL